MSTAPSPVHTGYRPGALFVGAALGALLVAALVVLGLALRDDGSSTLTGTRGSGVAATETRDLAPFSAVDLAGSNNVTIGVGGDQLVVVRADDNLLGRVTTEVRDGTLVIAQTGSFQAVSPMSVQVTVPSLDGLRLSGSGVVLLEGHELDKLTVDFPGSGTLRGAGTVTRLDVGLDGSGFIAFEELVAEDASVILSGSGTVVVNVAGTLEAKVSGSGAVMYSGNPQRVERQVTGTGAIVGK